MVGITRTQRNKSRVNEYKKSRGQSTFFMDEVGKSRFSKKYLLVCRTKQTVLHNSVTNTKYRITILFKWLAELIINSNFSTSALKMVSEGL